MAQNQGTLFESYEASYCSAATSVSNSLAGLSAMPLEQRQAKAKQLDKEVRDAEQILQRLDMEARSFSTEQSRPYLQKIKEYRADLKKLKEDVKKAASGVAGGSSGLARAELGLADDYYQTSAGQRERLLSATERLGKTSDRIQKGRQQLLETEATGAAILEDLQRQRQAIDRSREQLQQTDASITESDSILKKMGRWWRF
ncbi:hypothetical protein Ndes2526B_g07211 [Nannochloris sp. 'desiccata']